MASSLGRIALGVVGALIGAPFGLSAIGFSIGSAVGGAIFAPDGPKTEGPRLGDTNVSASSLGKVLTEHYGVTRSSGNMIWSAGLKEVKVKTKQSGGKGGGGSATNTTYEYYASFAMAFGRAPGITVRKIWADGKIIYDGTGYSGTAYENTSKFFGSKQSSDEKYKFRFCSGGDDQVIDPLIAESINRRLAGMPDVNEGNQEQADYQSINDIIATAYAAGDDRSSLYGDLLTAKKEAAETAAGGGVPDYEFTPAYRGFCYIIFDDMPLEDFGNRIPNLTAEIVWGGSTLADGTSEDVDADTVNRYEVTQIGELAAPSGLMALDYNNRKMYGLSEGYLRRFTGDNSSEDLQSYINTPPPEWTGRTPTTTAERGVTVNRLLAVGSEGTVYAFGTFSHKGPFGTTLSTSSLLMLSGTGLVLTGPVVEPVLPDLDIQFGTHIRMSGTIPAGLFGNSGTDGEHMAFVDDEGGFHAVRISRSTVMAHTTASSATDATTPFGGPLVTGPSIIDGAAECFHCAYSASSVKVVRYEVTNNTIKNQWRNSEEPEIDVNRRQTRSYNLGLTTDISGISALVYNSATDDVLLLVALVDGTSVVVRFNDSMDITYVQPVDATPPLDTSGLSRSDTSNGTLAFASGRDVIAISIADGTYRKYSDVLTEPAANVAQSYSGLVGGLLVWEQDTPYIFSVGRSVGASRGHDIADTLPRVVRSVCERAGMLPDEFDVSGLSSLPVRGYSVSRPSTGRQVLETLLQAYFADGIETDWKVVFSDRSTDSVRTIEEAELGEISGPTGAVNWLESRTPEYEIPAEVNLNYSDPVRDYQTGTAHKKRISNPIPSMYSDTVENIELPLVLFDSEAADIAERLLYLSWMSRDRAKSTLNWKHADLDPGDVVSVKFKDGRIVTDRISKATIGANFEIEVESARSNDPVYVSAPQTIITTGSIPSNNISVPVNSRAFVLDIPLLYDYHDTSRNASRFYTAVGADSDKWRSATIFGSWDNGTFLSFADAAVDATWGTTVARVLPPRSLWTTDRDTEIHVALSVDNGDLVSVTRDQIISGANRAIIWDPVTGVAEIIQFQNATLDDNGTTYILTDLVRGLRGTEGAVDKHLTGAYFILLQDSFLQINDNELSRIGTTGYFKAVSAGQLISAVGSSSITFRGNDLKPWAPSRVRRTDNGADVTVTWNRRTRVGGAWNMLNTYETVALSEDFEQYEIYLLPAGTTAQDSFDPGDPSTYHTKASVTGSTTYTFTAAVLSSYGYAVEDTINVAVYQISGQVGRGFARIGGLAP